MPKSTVVSVTPYSEVWYQYFFLFLFLSKSAEVLLMQHFSSQCGFSCLIFPFCCFISIWTQKLFWSLVDCVVLDGFLSSEHCMTLVLNLFWPVQSLALSIWSCDLSESLHTNTDILYLYRDYKSVYLRYGYSVHRGGRCGTNINIVILKGIFTMCITIFLTYCQQYSSAVVWK